jgi:hypothetical protein
VRVSSVSVLLKILSVSIVGSPLDRTAQLWWPSRHLEMTFSLVSSIFRGQVRLFFLSEKKISFWLGGPLPWKGGKEGWKGTKFFFQFFSPHVRYVWWIDRTTARAVPWGILGVCGISLRHLCPITVDHTHTNTHTHTHTRTSWNKHYWDSCAHRYDQDGFLHCHDQIQLITGHERPPKHVCTVWTPPRTRPFIPHIFSTGVGTGTVLGSTKVSSLSQ